MKLLCALTFSLLLVTVGCGDTIVNIPPSPVAPTTVTVPVPSPPIVNNSTTIELRVIGNATSVRVRYSNPVDGLVQVVTSLPFEASYTITAPSLFISVDVTPISFSPVEHNPFIACQIIVNGTLFREATTSDFSFTTLVASGTWRK